jgi:hypothetical protein
MYSTRFAASGLAALALLALAVPVFGQQAAAAPEGNRKVAEGGIKIPGWKGTIEASEVKQGEKVDNALLAMDGSALHVVTGPAITYWKPSDTASGDYTVKATFTEPQYMNLNDHPHPYGIVIGGNAMGTPQETYLYCAAYGNGSFIVRGFGPEPFQLNGRRGEANAAVHKAPGKDQPVTQDIALSVKGDQVQCAINGTVVGSYPKSAVLGAGKLKSTDGNYGIRVAHNAEVKVTGLTMVKQ